MNSSSQFITHDNAAARCLTLINHKNHDISLIISQLKNDIHFTEIIQRAPHVFDFICSKNTQINIHTKEYLYQLKIDFALQNIDSKYNKPTKKFFLSDMDATIVVGETIDEIAEISGKKSVISKITQKAMRGELDFKEALNQRLFELKGINKNQIQQLAQKTNITPNADKLLDEINRLGLSSCLISGGFSLFTEIISKQLGFQKHIANELSFDENNQLDGKLTNDIVTAQTKLDTLVQLTQQQNIDLSESIAIGDGANDALMIKKAGLGIAFYGKPKLRAIANAEIHAGNIDDILWFF